MISAPLPLPPSLRRVRLLALAGAALGATITLAAAWALLAPDIEPAFGALAVPALVGPIVHPRLAPRPFIRYLLIGVVTASFVLLLSWMAR
jgi:hypothetical protein